MTRKKVQIGIGAAALAVALAAGSALAATSLSRQSGPTQSGPGPAKPPTGTTPSLLLPLQAELSSRNVPTLQVASTAAGRFIGAVGPRGGFTLFWVVAVEHTTGPVTGVEIRTGSVSAAAGPKVLSLCAPCRTTASFVTGRVGPLTGEQLDALRTHALFVNVITRANPSGELRGQLKRKTPTTTSSPNTRMPPLEPAQRKKITGIVTIPSS